MTYALTYIEIDVDFCALRYGVAPCSAVLGVKADRKCFNTIKTCQARADFTNAPVTLRFAIDTLDLPRDIECIPCLEEVSFSPATISLGENIGIRANLSATLKDQPHPDTGRGFDPYWRERGYDPWTRGTLFGRFRARQPYLFGRNMRLVRGEVGQRLDQMEVRHFILDSFEGPSTDGKYTLKAKDALVMTSGDRAQAPRMSRGLLNEAITATATTAVLSPAGIGDVEYPASGFVAIGGKEIVAFTRVGDILTFTARAQRNTPASAHDAQDHVQLCLDIVAQTPATIIANLERGYASVPSAMIPQAAWENESQAFYRRLMSRMIAEPTSVETLVNQVIQQSGVTHHWDEVARQLRFQVLRQIPTDAFVIDEDTMMDSPVLDITEQPDRRVSQVWVYFAPINPLKKADDADNYRSRLKVINGDAEADYGTPAIKKIFAPWIPALGRNVAQRVADIQLGRFRDPPRRFSFSLSRTGGFTPVLGRGYQLSASVLQTDTGERELVPIQITKLTPRDDRYDVVAEELQFISFDEGDLGNKTLIADANITDLNWRASYDQFFPPPVAGDVVKLIIEENVYVGSTSVTRAAVTVGDWPEGVILLIENHGRIQGRGGDGGRISSFNWIDGQPGGTALYTRHPINVTGAGEIWAGGGGGSSSKLGSGGEWAGGGGGQGYVGGSAYNNNPRTASTPGSPEAPGARGRGAESYGGAGGIPGQPGKQGDAGNGSPGAGGKAIDGNSFVTLAPTIDVKGSRIN